MHYHPRMRIPHAAFAILLPIAAACNAAPPPAPRPAAANPESAMNLPKTAGPWTRPDAPKRVDAASIFDYMDGGGELYLAYRFDHLDVYEYTAAGRDPILAELYWMKGSDDAFGLLSNDWGGDVVELGASGVRGPKSEVRSPASGVPSARALYGAGLLRIWSDTLYVRLLAGRETPESRDQVMALGRAIVAGRKAPARPALLDALPEDVGGRFRILGTRACFLRSHLVLNSAYFLSSTDILDLSPAVQAVVAPYDPVRAASGAPRPASGAGRRPYLFVARYGDATTARRAFEHFATAYLPEARVPASGPAPVSGAQRIEHGWVGFHLQSDALVLVFDAPDEASAKMLVSGIRL